MYAHVSHLLRVSEHPSAWLTVSLFLPSCARSCPTSCGFDCQHVCKSFCIHLAKLCRFSCRSEHRTLFIWGRERCFLWATVSEFLFDEVIKKLLYYSGKQMKTLCFKVFLDYRRCLFLTYWNNTNTYQMDLRAGQVLFLRSPASIIQKCCFFFPHLC